MLLLTIAMSALLTLSIDPVFVAPDTAKPSDGSITQASKDPDMSPTAFGWSAQLMLSLNKSKSPRDWALLGEILGHDKNGPVHAGGAMLRKAAAAAPMDRVVQQLWANASLDGSGCDSQHPCPDRATAWARLEPDNDVAWFPVVAAASLAKGIPAIDAAIEQFAHASRYDDSIGDLLRAWKDVFQRCLST